MSADPLTVVWMALEAHDCKPRGESYNFRARCPAHDGDNADALHVQVGADGRAVLYCHAHRCEAKKITDAIKLDVTDLFPDGHRDARPAKKFADKTTPESDDAGALGEVPAYPVGALPKAAQALIGTHALPPALIGGPILAALATAIGGRGALDVTDSWRERAILWVANVAPPGAGKSPAQTLAFKPLRDADADVLADDMTLEALARVLADRDGAIGLDVDELAQLIRGLGEYKGGGSGDRARLLARWEGGPWNAGRVGDGKKGKLGVDLRIPRPTVVTTTWT
jgi:hypothetical protein